MTEPTEENIIAELIKMNEEWLEHFKCERLGLFVEKHPNWEGEFEVGECMVSIPEEFQCSESDGEHPCGDCPLQPLEEGLPKDYLGDTPERRGKPKKHGHGSPAEGPDGVNL